MIKITLALDGFFLNSNKLSYIFENYQIDILFGKIGLSSSKYNDYKMEQLVFTIYILPNQRNIKVNTYNCFLLYCGI